MKSTLLRTFFEWALITSVLMSVGFFLWFWQTSRASRAFNAELTAPQSQFQAAQTQFQNNQVLLGLLRADCQAYAKTNADMARFLNSEPTQPPAAPAPATKPKAK
jgi:hypothetical protein